MWRITCCAMAYLLFMPNEGMSEAAYPRTIEGKAIVNDGDSITIDGQRIRLQGIDAPELAQQCYRDRQPYQCGVIAKESLRNMITNRSISCQIEGVDQYKRYLGHCFRYGQNLNARMVETGNALAYRRYSKRYIQQEEQARANNLGIHRMKYTYPWDWRKKNRR
jgi:endonuclease YncB( thermonuclease family)